MTAAPRFHHADAGTSEATWLRDPRWASAPLVDVPGIPARYDEVFVVAAHPDDETLGVGGLVAGLHRAGARLRVLVATSGEHSHPEATTWRPEDLGEQRREELSAAMARLAPGAHVEVLDHPDGGLAGRADLLVEDIAFRCGPRSLVVAPWREDGHGDHDALGRAAAVAAAERGATVAYYPIWLWHWGSPDADLPWECVHVVEPAVEDLRSRADALTEYPSQAMPLGPRPGDAPVLTGATLRRAERTVEVLLADEGVLPVRRHRADLDVADPFDEMYLAGDDPWGFESSFYERRKRALTTAVLGSERYRSVLEIGCATGVLTRELAGRADRVVAVDVSAAAVARARRDAPSSVDWVVGRAPEVLEVLSEGPFDLVVLSEVGYFMTPLELLGTLRIIRERLAPGGEVVLVHWRHPTRDVPLDGPTVHGQALTALGDLPHRVHHEDGDVLVDVLGGPESVAAAEGRR